MTHIEAVEVAEIMLSADGNCSFCANELIKQLAKTYPDHSEAVWKVYNSEYENKA